MLTQARLKELLAYDPATGVFRWRVARPGMKVGDVAGAVKPSGYIIIGIDGKRYQSHRLAFLYMEGEFPPDMVDHINGDPSDNRWCNLRKATPAQNIANGPTRRNNKLGIKGVYRRGKRFAAAIHPKGVTYHLGTFDTIAEAAAAYERAANDHFGDFARTA